MKLYNETTGKWFIDGRYYQEQQNYYNFILLYQLAEVRACQHSYDVVFAIKYYDTGKIVRYSIKVFNSPEKLKVSKLLQNTVNLKLMSGWVPGNDDFLKRIDTRSLYLFFESLPDYVE